MTTHTSALRDPLLPHGHCALGDLQLDVAGGDLFADETFRPAAPARAKGDYREWPDEDVYSAYRSSGDREAFAELDQRWRERLINYVAKLLPVKERASAEDIVQETLSKVANDQNHNPDAPFRPWLYTIAYHSIISHLRQAKLRRRDSMLSLEALLADNSTSSILRDTQSPSPDESACRRELQALVQRLIRAEREREQRLRADRVNGVDIFLAVVRDGVTFRDAAELFQTAKCMVQRSVARVRQNLGQRLLEAGLGPEDLPRGANIISTKTRLPKIR